MVSRALLVIPLTCNSSSQLLPLAFENLGIKIVIVEIDYLDTVHLIDRGYTTTHKYGVVINDIKLFMEYYEHAQINHILRETNPCEILKLLSLRTLLQLYFGGVSLLFLFFCPKKKMTTLRGKKKEIAIQGKIVESLKKKLKKLRGKKQKER